MHLSLEELKERETYRFICTTGEEFNGIVIDRTFNGVLAEVVILPYKPGQLAQKTGIVHCLGAGWHAKEIE